LSGCPVKAYEKDPLTGIVKHLDDQCFGCKYCTMMCPYEVPQYSATLGIVRKCDMCHQRLANHEAPACVQACPNKAIRIQSVETAVVRQRGALTEAALLPTAPPNSITLPTTLFVSKRTIPANVLSAEVVSDEPHEGHWPLVGMLVLTQASVGLWLMIALSLAIKVASTIELKLASIIATSLGVVGVHLALLHLGRPQLAYRAFLGWRTSWLSREAIAFGVYMAAASVATIAILFADVTSDWLGATAIILLTMTVALIGIAGVFCSAMIYVATQRELWNKRRTLSGFLGTLVALGLSLALLTTNSDIWGTFALLTCIVTAATFAPQVIDVARSSSSSSPSPRFGERGPGGEGLSLASPQFPHPSPLLRKARGEGANEVQPTDFSSRSGKLITKHLARPWYLMWFCFLGAVICSGLVYVTTGNTTLFGVLSVVLFFASHLIHRWIYFSAIVTYRMPGAST
jgi:DMSO reductase anchor subunit/ferredoxin